MKELFGTRSEGNVLLLRHGHTRPGQVWRYTGQREVPLTSAGREQARQWAQNLANRGISSIWSSPLGRCLETSHILGQALKADVQTEAALKEIDLGEWEGLTKDDVRRRYPGAYEERGKDMAGYRPPQGESFQDLLERVLPFARQCLESRALTLAVTHAGVIRVLSCWAEQKPIQRLFDFSPAPGSMCVIEQKGKRVKLIQTCPGIADRKHILTCCFV